MPRPKRLSAVRLFLLTAIIPIALFGQGVTTSSITGFVTDDQGEAMLGANVVAVHTPSGTKYGTTVQPGGAYTIVNMKVGGPYTLSVSLLGYKTHTRGNLSLNLGTPARIDVKLVQEAVELAGVEVAGAAQSEITGPATFIGQDDVLRMPSIKRSTRDLTRLDPRSDGNLSFAGRNWLYNNISVDGSYFNNPFGLDDPAPGGQTNAEPVPYDAVEQVQVSVAPFDVREGGFTGAGINTVTRSGSNRLAGSAYSYVRNESLMGNEVAGEKVVANPSLTYNQSGFTISGPILPNKLFFFANAEMERRVDPASNFVADTDGNVEFGESRVSADVMDAISDRMMEVYGYETGPYQDYTHQTNNDKLLVKFDYNLNDKHNASVRFNWLNAMRELPPHGFVLSFNNTGRGPNASSLPFKNSGYAIHNDLVSLAAEVNSILRPNVANRFFFSYNRFRDHREPFSVDFPTIEIGEAGVTYTTVGHEPFSIHNILDQDVIQVTDNVTVSRGRHVYTGGFNYERFKFFNSFNIFRHGVFFLPDELFDIGFILGGTTFESLDEFFAETDPDSAIAFDDAVGLGPYKGEKIDVGQLSFYAQDEYLISRDLRLTYGLRIDIPQYYTEPVDNPFSRELTLLDENDDPETVDQSKLPDAKPILSPRLGFSWDVRGDRSLVLRGGSGIFTGRLPFVWVGNVISNPGNNPNLFPNISEDDALADHQTDDGEGRTEAEGKQSILKTSYDLNAMDPDFSWPQVWNTNLAVETKLPYGISGTIEMLYGKDRNSIYMRNADLRTPMRTLEDGRPYFGGSGYPDNPHELNSDGGAGVYVIDNTDKGWNMTLTGQLRKAFDCGVTTSLAYTYLDARNNLKSTEIASVLWQNQPVQGDPNKPELSYAEFGNRHRIVGAASYRRGWNDRHSTNVGLFFEMAEGNRYTYAGGNRYSFIYSGDVNGDGYGGNDLIYIPQDADHIQLEDASEWDDLDAFIKQDPYLSQHRGEIAERFGLINPWFTNIDLRVVHDIGVDVAGARRTVQFSLDLLNAANLVNSDWGVRQVANPAATSPLTLTGWENDEPVFDFTGPSETFMNDPGEYSRWRMQLGVKFLF